MKYEESPTSDNSHHVKKSNSIIFKTKKPKNQNFN